MLRRDTGGVRLSVLAIWILSAGSPLHAADRFWSNPNGGTFTNTSNWQNGLIAGPNDVAHFGTSAGMFQNAFTVTTLSNTTNQGLSIDDDNVTFDLLGRTYSTTGSFSIGTQPHSIFSPGGGALTVIDGIVNLPFQSHVNVGAVANAAGALTVSTGGRFGGQPSLNIGALGTGALTVQNGGVVIPDRTRIGTVGGTFGMATITGASSELLGGELVVGDAGDGTLNIAGGGYVESDSGIIANLAGSAGTVSVSDAGSMWMNAGVLEVGANGPGNLELKAGAHVENTSSYIGGYFGSTNPGTGEVTVTGAGSLWTNSGEVNVGFGGDGSLDITDGGRVDSGGSVSINGHNVVGTLNVTTGGQLHSSGGSAGVTIFGDSGTILVSGTGSLWMNSGSLELGGGVGGHGTMSITAGGHVQNTSSSIGVDVGGGLGDGAVMVSGPGSLWTNSSDVNVGYGGEGTLDVSNDGQTEIDGQLLVGGAGKGTLNITMGGYVHSHGGSAGVGVTGIQSDITVAGTGSLWMDSGELRVGDAGISTLQITGGGAVQNTIGWVGASDVGFEGTGEVSVSGAGSLWTNSDDLNIGLFGSGTVNVSAGGSVEINGELVVGSIGNSMLNITGGGQVHSVGAARLAVFGSTSSVTVAGAGSHWTIDGQLSIGGLIDDSDDAGIGTVRVQSGATVSVGSFTILFADDLLSLEGGTFSTTDLSFRGGGTFGWTSGTLHVGKYRGSLTIPSGGVLAPGNSVGQTTVDVNYSQSAGGTLEIEIASATSADFVNVTGFADLGGNLQLKLLSGFIPNPATNFTIFDSRGINGAFANVANGQRLTTVNGLGSFLVHYGAASPFDPTQIVLSDFLVAPLPGDYNQNGIVDAADYTAWRNHLGSATALPNDNTPGVAADDYVRWKTHFGQTAGVGAGSSAAGSAGGSSAAVPEPASLALLLAAAGMVRIRRRRACPK